MRTTSGTRPWPPGRGDAIFDLVFIGINPAAVWQMSGYTMAPDLVGLCGFPDEMLEAGTIDGAGFFGLDGRIVVPLSLPGFVVVIIWQFTQIWNEFLFAVTLTSQSTQPITVALAQLAGGEAVRWNLPMAGAILAALPTLLVYVLLGRYFVKGLLAGSVKG